MKHPIQPLDKDEHGNIRFKRNPIVCRLLDITKTYKFDMNEIARAGFCAEDRQQFAQLIGYSLSGYGELPYVDAEAYATAEGMFANKDKSEAEIRIKYLEGELKYLKEALVEPMGRLFEIHVDDLTK